METNTVVGLGWLGDEATEALVEDLLIDIDRMSTQMTHEIRASIPEFSETMHEEIAPICRAHLLLVCELLSTGTPPEQAQAPTEALAHATRMVRLNIPFEALTRKYRVGHSSMLRQTLGILHDRVDNQDELALRIAAISEWTFRYVDAVSSQASAAYLAERERWVRSAAATRREEVNRILAGNQADEAQASRRLAYELGRPQLAVSCWSDCGDVDGLLEKLERLAHDVVELLGGQSHLSIPLSGTELTVWASPKASVDDPALLAELGAAAARKKAGLALGEVHRGIAGFRRTYEEARRAQRIAMLTKRSPTAPLRYRDAALVALMTNDLDEARAFVRMEIGPLLEDTDPARRITATLRAYLEENASFVRTGRRLGVHANTVMYRVRRAEELLGRGASERPLETLAALQLAETLRRAGGL